MYLLLFFLALLPTILFAGQSSISSESEILNSPHTPLTTLYGVPDTNIFGVNVINGDYSYSSVDFDLPGADPLIFHRTYCSSNYQYRAFYHTWTHNHCGLVNSYKSKKHLHVIISGALSGEIPFRQNLKDKEQILYINRDILEKGVTNCGQGEISGRSNIKNMEVTYWTNAIDVRNADGTEHCYYRAVDANEINGGSLDYLGKKTKPNGVVTVYKAEGYLLNEAVLLTHENKPANWISFNHPGHKKLKKIVKRPFSIEGSSSDGRTARYFFNWHKKHPQSEDKANILMSKFESSHLPVEHYSYTDPNDGAEKLKNLQGEHHRTKIDYYQKGDKVHPYGLYPQEVSSDHIARNRVKKIEVAVSALQDLQTIFQFAYYKNRDTKKAFTDVYNQHNHLSRFHYSTKDYRLNCVEKYKGTSDYTLYCRERLSFGEKDTSLVGDLLFKTVEKPDGTVSSQISAMADSRSPG